MDADTISAALLVIGDEILSGRTTDQNIGAVARFLADLGVDLAEVRVVADRTEAIVEAVNALRARYDEVFTTGGIGPTHDDITADSIAVAFGVAIAESAEAIALMAARYGEGSVTDSRRRMARIPEGATLIANPVSAAPGFTIENVHVMAGVPEIAAAMLKELAPTLRHGRRREVAAILVAAGESAFAEQLGEIQRQFADVAIGSYPKITEQGFRVEIVLRCADIDRLRAATRAVEAMAAAVSRERGNDPGATSGP